MTNCRSHLLKWIELPNESKRNIFEAVAEDQGLSPEAVEKGWWLVLTLDLVFSMACGKSLVFKGGTSLSKGWGLIQRFSEDIDLVLDRSLLGFIGELGKNQRDKLRKASVSYAIEQFTPELQQAFIQAGFSEVRIEALKPESSDNDPVKVDIYFTKLTVADGYLKPGLQIELGARSLREPFTVVPIQSLVGSGVYFKGADFTDDPIEIPIVNPERTFLEKILLLHEEHQRPEEKRRVDRLSRHLYDIYQLWNAGMFDKAFTEQDLFDTIVAHRQRYSKVKGVDYAQHRPNRISFLPPENMLDAWEKDYQMMQESMIYGVKPSFSEMCKALAQLQSEINVITWK